MPPIATHFGNTNRSSSGLPLRFCSPILAPSFIVRIFLFPVLNLLSILSDAAISRGRWAGDFCQIDHLVDTRASILSTFTADLMLLALKLVGILRWNEARQRVGTWRLLYSEVSLSSSRSGRPLRPYNSHTQHWPQGLTWVVVFTLANVPPVVRLIPG